MKNWYLKNIKIMTFIYVFIGCFLMAGCNSSNPADVLSSGESSGVASVTIHTGKIGVLAKRNLIEMKKLIIQIRVKGTDAVVLSDTTALSGYGETVFSKTYPKLVAPENYILAVSSIDAGGIVIHSGSTEFLSIPADTVNVSLNLDAKYSMLRVSFNTIPDSVRNVALGIALADTLDSTFVCGFLDTVKLTYDYLTATKDGVNHAVSLRASGSYYGKDTVLYASDTIVNAVSGMDKSYIVTLKWVGPGVPPGAATMTVTIGAVGTTILNTGFTEMGGLSELVDDLEDGDWKTRYNTVWYTYTDSIAYNGSSKINPPYGSFSPATGGALNSRYSASFSYTLNKGVNPYDPYIGMGFNLDTVSGLDISSATGVKFYFKGSASSLRIETMNITDYDFWCYLIPASTDWKLVELSWDDFSQNDEWGDEKPFDRSVVKNISFEVKGKTGDTGTVWVDDFFITGFFR